MVKLNGMIILAVAVFAFSGQCFAENITREGAEELIAQCQRERYEHIEADKEKVIVECVEKQRNSKEYCDRYYKDYGLINASGTVRGMYWGLPICEKSFKVEKYFRMNPSKNVYTGK